MAFKTKSLDRHACKELVRLLRIAIKDDAIMVHDEQKSRLLHVTACVVDGGKEDSDRVELKIEYPPIHLR